MEELIIGKARSLFFRYGLKSVSMDDVSRQAGISKKTVYQFVSDKNKLVLKVVQQLVQCHNSSLQQCRLRAADAVEEVVLQAMMPFATLAAISHSFLYDLEKFFPPAWQLILRRREEDLLPCIAANLKRGMEEAVYREDLDPEITAHIRLQHLQSVLQPGAFSGLRSGEQQLLNRLTRFYLQAITNSRGSGLLKKYVNENHYSKLER